MAYDEDRQLTLAMDREMTLMERNVKAEGKNFDTTTAKRARFSKPRLPKFDMSWHDGKEICINWNRRGCSDDKKCGRVHACLACKKMGHQERRCFSNSGISARTRQSDRTENN